MPSKKHVDSDSRRQRSRQREYQKFIDEKCFIELDIDENGREIIPEGSIVLRMLELSEYKWKADPDSGEMVWLESTRAVIDGSKDTRDVDFYAGTPSRTVFLLLLSIEATLGVHSVAADAVRAYLNAENIDRNIIVIFSKGASKFGMKRIMLLNKGGYGTKGGAISWEIWFDKQAVDIRGFSKCRLAQCVYTKKVENEIVRLFRHSDDIRMSCKNLKILSNECAALSSLIRMSEWAPPTLFLGCSIEYGHHVVLLRFTAKIYEAKESFEKYCEIFNPRGRVRNTSLPINYFQSKENFWVRKKSKTIEA